MSLQGSQDLVAFLGEMDEAAETLGARMSDPLHDAVVEQMQLADIPVASGDLDESLTDPSSPLHVWTETEDGVEFSSLAKAARYNPDAVPDIDVDALAEVAAEVF